MRLALILSLLATQAQSWEFSPRPICTLSHDTGAARVTVTYDASLPLYSITLTLRDQVWPDAGVFAMVFSGGRDIAIQTDRHRRSADGRSLTVTDRSFGNVLDGLALNTTAMAIAGDQQVPIPLDGIAPAITAFRACPADQLS